MTQDTRAVRRRRVFYIPGFDPHPPRRYRELYRREGAEQARIAGYRLEMSGVTGAIWTARTDIHGHATEARIEVLPWSDLVRDTMTRGFPASYAKLFRVAWVYISTGALRRLARIGRGPIVAAFYPVVGLLLQALAAGLLGWAVAAATGMLLPGWGWIPGLAAAWGLLSWARARDGRVFVHYLIHDFAYWASAGGAYPAALEARITAFAGRIRDALDEETTDEVLVVGHSSGASLALSAVAEAVEGPCAWPGPALSLLTLGQSIPMQSFLPGAERLRRDLNRLSVEDRITWIDVSAPGDGCSFALADPVAVSGVAPPDKRWPLVLSAAFSQTLSPDRRRRLRHRYFRLHFQYLCAFDDPGPYDYFRITAGPETLGQRFARRAPSASRIEAPTSGHVSMAA